jgi:hypothetical protein
VPDRVKKRQRPSVAAPGGGVGTLLMRDVMDAQLESADRRRIGRVGDLEAELSADGRLRVTTILVGPQVLLGRLSHRLGGGSMRFLGDRFLHRVAIDEVEEVGPTVRLRGVAETYSTAQGDKWVADKILRFIPGSGRASR